MKKFILLLPLLLMSFTTIKNDNIQQPNLVGTIQMWVDGDRTVYLTYTGQYPYCFMKYAIDDIFVSCEQDSMLFIRYQYDQTFPGLHIVPMDTLKIDSAGEKKTKIQRI